jgi:ureidoacrylate peracid hydrolase
VIEKTRYSAFFKTDLDRKLHQLGIRSLIVTGVGTDVCVETTCRDGFMRDYYIIVPGDLVATTSEESHKHTLAHLNRYFATLTTASEILQCWKVSL